MPLSRDDGRQLLLYGSCYAVWSLPSFNWFYKWTEAFMSPRLAIYDRNEEENCYYNLLLIKTCKY